MKYGYNMPAMCQLLLQYEKNMTAICQCEDNIT